MNSDLKTITESNTRQYIIYDSGQAAINQADAEDQVTVCQKYLTTIGFDPELFTVISDDGKPGPSSTRPGLEAVKKLSEAKLLAVLVVVSLNQLGRHDSVIHQVRDIVVNGGRVIAVRNSFDSAKEEWELTLRADLAGAVAMWTALRVKIGQMAKFASIATLGSGLPLGYVCQSNPNLVEGAADAVQPTTTVVDPKAASLVKSAFEFILQGWTIGGISLWLTEHGAIATARVVRRLLTDSRYKGVWGFRKTCYICTSRGARAVRAVAPAKVVNVMREELRIVSDEVFDKAQNLITRSHKRDK